VSRVFEPGETIIRREVLHAQLWMSHPVTVVADNDAGLAVLTSPGTPFTFPDHPFGPHPWAHLDRWQDTWLLEVVREGDRYAAWRIFDAGPSGPVLRHVYLNFEAPLERDADGYRTLDHGLDLVVHQDGRREWKDVPDLHAQLRAGRIDKENVLAVLAETEHVIAELDSGHPWWSAWEGWLPAVD
jgi:Uncharacterized conserved protein